MKELVLKKTINGEEVELKVTVYDAAETAIKYNWESLAFCANEDSFISIKVKDKVFDLVTNGEVEIIIEKKDADVYTLTNKDYEAIKNLVDTKEIYNDNIIINHNNWFAVMYGTLEEDNTYDYEDDYIFEESPTSIDELVDAMCSYVEHNLSCHKEKYPIIGEILEDGTIERGCSAQGLIYKNPLAFMNKTGVCYVPELTDTQYTYNDFVDEAMGNEDIAARLFDFVDWQSPSTLFEEWLDNDEVHVCTGCNKAYFSYDVDTCPYCGKEKEL